MTRPTRCCSCRRQCRQPAQDALKADVLAGRIALDELETDAYDLYAHQNEDIEDTRRGSLAR